MRPLQANYELMERALSPAVVSLVRNSIFVDTLFRGPWDNPDPPPIIRKYDNDFCSEGGSYPDPRVASQAGRGLLKASR